jgi:serine/threonine protein kinase
VHRCRRITVTAYDPKRGQYHRLENVLLRDGNDSQDSGHSLNRINKRGYLPANKNKDSRDEGKHCYYIKRKIATSVYGSVYKGVVLKRRDKLQGETLLNGIKSRTLGVIIEDDDFENTNHKKCAESSRFDLQSLEAAMEDDNSIWDITKSNVIIKTSCWKKLRRLRGKHLEDPLKEIQAMQLLGNYNPHVRGSLMALQDDDFLYSVMDYCKDGDLYSVVMREISSKERLKERTARHYFRQMLIGLHRLQQKGVCHRDLRLENIMVHSRKIKIIDFGLALRVPYENITNSNCPSDASSGNRRMLISAQGQCGELTYMCPEILEREPGFDGFAADLWALGVMLYIMLIGRKPFHWAHPSDEQFQRLSIEGGLKESLEYWNISLSDDAVNLLQQMLWKDKEKRLTLAMTMNHPWVSFEEPVGLSPSSVVSQSSISSTSTFSNRSQDKKSIYDKWLNAPS